MIVVHVTHEAVEKIGGIGAVIAGLMNAEAYAKNVTRTVILGPLLTTDRPVNKRLGEGGHVIYSSLDAVDRPPWREKFRPIERTYDCGIIYGTRAVDDPCTGRSVKAEVVLVDVFHTNQHRLNLFKYEMWKKFNVPSERFQHIWEYEEYVRLAEPGYEALKAIGCINGEELVILAHEYMGMPTALKAVMDGSPGTRTVFYAHEVASVRPIVEAARGNDTLFYNVLCAAEKEQRTIEDVFPSVHANYKHPLVKAARYCDHVFAVGDYVESELRFLDPHFRTQAIDLVYNGIPAEPTTIEAKQASLDRMKGYAKALVGYRPTWIFTHVCRPVASKGIWHDLEVLHELEELLKARGESAVYFLLGTLAGQRRSQDIRHMEKVYGWPVNHEKGYPDLCGGEEGLGDLFAQFNREHEAAQAIFVNQWDWNRGFCGDRMSEDMTFQDIRAGTHVEFGLSTYEPYGIAQFEPLGSGGLCVVTNVCGCAGFARCVAGDEDVGGNIIQADYLRLDGPMSVNEILHTPYEQREAVEWAEAKRLARLIADRLPRDLETLQARMTSGYELARRMSWERVVEDFFLPSLKKTVKNNK